MHVVATAGHVDHGKSTLVRALTGMEPDRWAEEQRRGMTIDLGYAWTDLPGGETVAFVDAPGHHRFVTNMLAGVGPAPAVLFVVAADEGWSRQSAEHLAALDALGVQHGVLAVTRCDLADPLAAQEESLVQISGTSLAGMSCVHVSAVTGAGLDELRREIASMLATLPAPAPTERVRLWVDRSFTIRGAGTVVTGTLQAGTLQSDQRLLLASTGEPVRIRRLESLGAVRDAVSAVARVAANISGGGTVERGDCLLTSGHWRETTEVDVRLTGHSDIARLPGQLMLHIGTAAVAVHVRRLGDDIARLTLQRALPLQNGDRGALRDPGRQEIAAGVCVLDAAPPVLSRRGAAAARAAALSLVGAPDAVGEVERRGTVRTQLLVELGCGIPPDSARVRACGDWLVSTQVWRRWRDGLAAEVDRLHAADPLAAGLSLDAARRTLNVPDREVMHAVATEDAALEITGGVVSRVGHRGALPAPIWWLVERLDLTPYDAPSAAELAAAGVTVPMLAAAERAGLLLRLGEDVVVTAAAIDAAVDALSALPQPFTLAAARDRLKSTRRVTLAVLEHLDATRRTSRDADLRRTIR